MGGKGGIERGEEEVGRRGACDVEKVRDVGQFSQARERASEALGRRMDRPLEIIQQRSMPLRGMLKIARARERPSHRIRKQAAGYRATEIRLLLFPPPFQFFTFSILFLFCLLVGFDGFVSFCLVISGSAYFEN